MNLYSIDIMIAATVYVKAENESDALASANVIAHECFEFSGGIISDKSFADPELPVVSLSPAMTGCGLFPQSELELISES